MSTVSIIMPAYNCEQYIIDAIRSVQAQTHTDWELLVVDDCSTDRTPLLVKEQMQQDTRIRYQRLKRHSGAAVARNTALQRAQGKYIAFLDADDIWMPDKLNRQIAFMEQNGYRFTYTVFHRVDIHLQSLPIVISGPKHITPRMMRLFCWPSCPAVMYDREAIGLVQIKPIAKHNDYAMWLQIIQKADCHLLEEDLYAYRKHPQSISSVSYMQLIRWHYKLWHDVENKTVLGSVFWTAVNIAAGLYKKLRYVSRR